MYFLILGAFLFEVSGGPDTFGSSDGYKAVVSFCVQSRAVGVVSGFSVRIDI